MPIVSKKRTSKSGFISQYGGEDIIYITPAQYIVEQLCTIIAKRNSKNLTTRFWQSKEWAAIFRSQICAANQLLKKYSHKAIIAAMRDKRLYRLTSLRSPQLPNIIDEYQKVVDFNKSQECQVIKLPEVEQTRPTTKKSSNILSKLRKL
jgi:hypothetical protein